MIYNNFVSIKNIIAKVYQDLDIKDEEPFVDFLEWGAEALLKIGVFSQFKKISSKVEIDNYRAELPEGLINLNQVVYNGIPVLSNSGSAGSILPDYPTPYAFYQEKIENSTYVEGGSGKQEVYGNYIYQINGGCIKTNFQRGFIHINYDAIILDEEGYPKVPDYVEFREALYWYINMKYTYPQWRRGEVADRVYQHAEQNWYWYCQQAANKGMIPDLNQLENITRDWLSLKPRIGQFQNLFNNY